MVHIKPGDVFDYPFWGKCVMSYENGVLVCKALDAGSDGSKTWKCNSASDTEKLIDGQAVNVSWDSGALSIKMEMKHRNLFLAYHNGTPYPFNRVEVQPNTFFKEGDRFNFEPWGSRCMVSFERGELSITNKSYKSHRDQKIKIDYSHQKTLCNGGHIDIYWARMAYKRLEMRDRDTIAVRWDGGEFKNFTRVPDGADEYDVVKTGDVFGHAFWGKCTASFENGVFILKSEDAGPDGKKTWKCFSAPETEGLMQGYSLGVNWENNGERFGSMRLEDKDTFLYYKGRVPYYFRRITEGKNKDVVKAGDAFHYPFWGKCIMSYENGALVCNGEGSSSDGAKTCKCFSASDTDKLFNGESVEVNWDNNGRTGVKMFFKDKDTFIVYHGETPYPIERIK